MRLIPIVRRTAVIALLAAQSAFAQTVRGVLVEEGSRAPVEGAFVVLLDEHGRRLGEGVGALSDATGRFVLRAREPGRYRLRAERIGFESTVSTLIELEVGETVDHVMVVPVQAVQLEELTVAAEPVCDVRPDVGARTAEVWEEARKALSVVAWAEAREMLQYRVVRHEREFDARTLRVRKERSWPSSRWARGSPFRSLPPEELAEGGYVQPAAADSFVYYAPDAAVVLSERFADLHCFGIKVRGGDREELIGLTFEPVPDRDLPDVEGVLWLDGKTAELQYLEYRYTRLPLPFRSDKIGGRVEFERLPSGVWIVSRWWIRMPIVWEAELLHPLSDRFRLAVVREEGGTVLDVRTAEGTPVR
ncbi:MAG: carboxypeptidase regulatory-like domain-containing protein [Gemmatimonadota bacterium]|nr:MAG: carboxypeptidase regulatory-like domain-containing protein [Gemmatimonadota bacterium]